MNECDVGFRHRANKVLGSATVLESKEGEHWNAF